MKSIIEISADTSDLKDHFDLLSCYLVSATSLHALACDGLAGRSGGVGSVTPEFWNKHFVTAFYLLRHSLELAVKALIKETCGTDTHGHDIKALWESVPDHQNIIRDQISRAFTVLAKYNVLKDAQLFRYHADKGGVKLKSMPSLTNDDFDAISTASWAVRQLVLERIHIKKGLPVP